MNFDFYRKFILNNIKRKWKNLQHLKRKRTDIFIRVSFAFVYLLTVIFLLFFPFLIFVLLLEIFGVAKFYKFIILLVYLFYLVKSFFIK